MKFTELTENQQRAIKAIEAAASGLNGKELMSRLSMDRKEALSTLSELSGLGICEKNMWNRSILTEKGQELFAQPTHDFVWQGL